MQDQLHTLIDVLYSVRLFAAGFSPILLGLVILFVVHVYNGMPKKLR